MKLRELHEAAKAPAYDFDYLNDLSPEELKAHIANVEQHTEHLEERIKHYVGEREHLSDQIKKNVTDDTPGAWEPAPLEGKHVKFEGWWVEDTPERKQLIRQWKEADKEITNTQKLLRKMERELKAAAAIHKAGGAAKGVNPIFKVSEKTTIENPFYKGSKDTYKGSPEQFKWLSPAMKKNYETIKQILAKHNLKLTTMYFGKWPVPKWGGGEYMANSFIIHTPNNEVVWYKYDSGPGSGQNHIYINGKKIKTSSFVNFTPEMFNQYFE